MSYWSRGHLAAVISLYCNIIQILRGDSSNGIIGWAVIIVILLRCVASDEFLAVICSGRQTHQNFTAYFEEHQV